MTAIDLKFWKSESKISIQESGRLYRQMPFEWKVVNSVGVCLILTHPAHLESSTGADWRLMVSNVLNDALPSDQKFRLLT